MRYDATLRRWHLAIAIRRYFSWPSAIFAMMPRRLPLRVSCLFIRLYVFDFAAYAFARYYAIIR